MNVEGSGDGTDGFAFEKELAGQVLLFRQHLLWPTEGNATGYGGLPAILRSGQDQAALELGDPTEDGHHHLAGR